MTYRFLQVGGLSNGNPPASAANSGESYPRKSTGGLPSRSFRNLEAKTGLRSVLSAMGLATAEARRAKDGIPART